MTDANKTIKDNSNITFLKALYLKLQSSYSEIELEIFLPSVLEEKSIKNGLINFCGKENLDLSILALNEIMEKNKIENLNFKREFKDYDFNRTLKDLKIELKFRNLIVENNELQHVDEKRQQIEKISNNVHKISNNVHKTDDKKKENSQSQKYSLPIKNQHDGFFSETFYNIPQNIDFDKKSIPTKNLKNIFGFDKFNYIQSSLLTECLNYTSNLVISAPTGMGKSEVALLTVLKTLLPNLSFNQKTKSFDNFNTFSKQNRLYNIIYLVPMKALASQTVEYLTKRLSIYNLSISEYTGDIKHLPKSDILVCTPEKFEFFLKKYSDKIQNIKLVVFDEIHILGTARGVCLEKIRYLLLNYQIRLVGLSATISNINSVAKFLKGKAFEFENKDISVDLSYLNTETAYQTDEILCNMLYYYLKQNISILLFVNKRRECKRIGNLFINFMIKNDLEIPIQTELNNLSNDIIHPNDLQLYQHKIGIHHSRLSKKYRSFTETLFKKGKINLLISTTTLAWGINLPAQIVIMKGLTYYNSYGQKVDYDMKDILQCVGRAGRRGFEHVEFENRYLEFGNKYELQKQQNNQNKKQSQEKEIKSLNNQKINPSKAHCFILGTQKELEKYKPQFFREIFLESYLLTNLADNLLTFITDKTCFSDLMDFYNHSYLKLRMYSRPFLYGITELQKINKTNKNKMKIIDQIFKEYWILSCKKLERNFCIEILKENDTIFYRKTKFGQIASLYNINHETMGNIIKLKYRNPKILESPLLFILFLIQNYEFSQVDYVNLRAKYLQKHHKEICLLPAYIEIEENWDIDFSEDIAKYKNSDILLNSKYSNFMHNYKNEFEEFSTIFIHFIVLIEMLKSKIEKKNIQSQEIIFLVDFFENNLGRMISGLMEIDEFKERGIIFWDDFFNDKLTSKDLDLLFK